MHIIQTILTKPTHPYHQGGEGEGEGGIREDDHIYSVVDDQI